MIDREEIDKGGPWWWSEICDCCWKDIVAPNFEDGEEFFDDYIEEWDHGGLIGDLEFTENEEDKDA